MSIGRVPGATGIQPSIVDAKGDLIVATAADSVDRLAVGSANQVLTVDSSTATGLKWATPTDTNGLVLISTTDFSDVATQSFNNVFTSTYTNYIAICYNIRSGSATATLMGRMRASGTDNTANSYSSYGLEARTTGSYLAFVGNSGQSAFNFRLCDNVRNAVEIKFYGPQLASTTLVDWNNNAVNNEYGFRAHGMHGQAVSYDGFTLYASTGNITGTVSIYGVQK